MTQTVATQTGAATARLPHLFYCSNECGTKAATPQYDTVTNANISVDTIYDLRLAQPNKKKQGARSEARRILRLYLSICVRSTLKHIAVLNAAATYTYTLGEPLPGERTQGT